MKFSVIVCDPPWNAKDKLTMSSVKRGASSNYKTMTTEDICNLPINDIADPEGCVLALWMLGSMLGDGMRVMEAWGFQQKQVYTWVKTKKEKAGKKLTTNDCLAFGLGRLFRQTHEIALIGINTTKIYKKLENRSQRSVSFGENKGHSIKPDHLQDSLDKMFPNAHNKVELFGRRLREGWTVVGNEVCDGEDIRDSIFRLKNA